MPAMQAATMGLPPLGVNGRIRFSAPSSPGTAARNERMETQRTPRTQRRESCGYFLLSPRPLRALRFKTASARPRSDATPGTRVNGYVGRKAAFRSVNLGARYEVGAGGRSVRYAPSAVGIEFPEVARNRTCRDSSTFRYL